jgi:outer membrane autotransporter protein
MSDKRPTDNGVWVAGSNSWVSKTDPNAKLHGQVIDSILGYDHKLDDKTVLGLAIGYEHYDFDTTYNNGTVKGASVSVAPYVGYAFTDWLSIDATAGHAWVNYDYTRGNDTIIGDTKANRWFGSTELAATQREGDARLRAALGFLKIYEEQKGYTESDGTANTGAKINLGEIRATVGGTYPIQQSWGVITPNAFVRYEYDVTAPHSVNVGVNGTTSAGRQGATFGLGADAQLDTGWKMGLAATTEEFRQDTSIYTVIGSVRYSF